MLVPTKENHINYGLLNVVKFVLFLFYCLKVFTYKYSCHCTGTDIACVCRQRRWMVVYQTRARIHSCLFNTFEWIIIGRGALNTDGNNIYMYNVYIYNMYNNKNPLSDRPSFLDFGLALILKGFSRALHANPIVHSARHQSLADIYNNVYEIFYCTSKLMYTIFSWRLHMWIPHIRPVTLFCSSHLPYIIFLSLFSLYPPTGNPPQDSRVAIL